MLEQLRAHWIASDERTALVHALHAKMAERLATVMPGGIVGGLAAELATTAIHEVDSIVAAPIQVRAQTITITDHRG